MLEEIYSDDSELNTEYNTSDLEKGTIEFIVTESYWNDDTGCNPVQSSSEIRSLGVKEVNKKPIWCELERQKEKIMACEKAKTAVQRKRKYTARRAKVDETTKKNSKKGKCWGNK